MTIAECTQLFERTTPPGTAWKHDNIGLLVGRSDAVITNILVTLDVTMDTAKEALRRKANLIVAHHPVIFRPLSAVTSSSRTGALVMFLIENNIAVYAAHTNFDSVRHGVSFALAAALGLQSCVVLSPMKDSFTKITVFVPASHAEQVARAMHAAGGGMFSNYEHCSFRAEGVGTFTAIGDARPYIGHRGVPETTPEIRLEMLVERWKVNAVVAAMRQAHPYEEIAFDVYALENTNSEYGLGALGMLPRAVAGRKLLSLVKGALGAEGLRYAGDVQRQVTRVAVCGGGGGDLFADALAGNADAFVTADLKYHQMQDASAGMLVIDAGHFETEHIALAPLAAQLRKIGIAAGARTKTFVAHSSTNPIHFC